MLLRCCCLCDESLKETLRTGGELFAERTGNRVEPEFYCDPIALYRRLGNGREWDAVLVALPGALGMEAATRVREENPDVPLIWCSDDRLFAVHSYRLRCAMFLLLPTTAERAAEALTRCAEQMGKGGS